MIYSTIENAFLNVNSVAPFEHSGKTITIDGMDPDEFICQNADPIWLHQNEMREYIDAPFDSDD